MITVIEDQVRAIAWFNRASFTN